MNRKIVFLLRDVESERIICIVPQSMKNWKNGVNFFMLNWGEGKKMRNHHGEEMWEEV